MTPAATKSEARKSRLSARPEMRRLPRPRGVGDPGHPIDIVTLCCDIGTSPFLAMRCSGAVDPLSKETDEDGANPTESGKKIGLETASRAPEPIEAVSDHAPVGQSSSRDGKEFGAAAEHTHAFWGASHCRRLGRFARLDPFLTGPLHGRAR